jgi:hypothetical protein
VRQVVSSAVGTAAKLGTMLAPELETWFAHKLTHLPKIETPLYGELMFETIEQVMKPFFGTHGTKASSLTEKGEHATSSQTIGRVQWTQVDP